MNDGGVARFLAAAQQPHGRGRAFGESYTEAQAAWGTPSVARCHPGGSTAPVGQMMAGQYGFLLGGLA